MCNFLLWQRKACLIIHYIFIYLLSCFIINFSASWISQVLLILWVTICQMGNFQSCKPQWTTLYELQGEKKRKTGIYLVLNLQWKIVIVLNNLIFQYICSKFLLAFYNFWSHLTFAQRIFFRIFFIWWHVGGKLFKFVGFSANILILMLKR